MAEFPAIPIFTDALLADCGYMSDEKFGAYHRLLYLIWRSPNCRIPNDDTWLSERLSRAPEIISTIYRPLIHSFCQSDGNWITQGRLLRERSYLRDKSKKQSERAKSRWNKDSVPSHGNADTGNAASGNAPTPTPSSVTNVTGESSPLDFKRIIFNEGLKYIGGEKQRSLLAKWVKEYGEAKVAGAIIEAQRANAIEPKTYIIQVLARPDPTKNKHKQTISNVVTL